MTTTNNPGPGAGPAGPELPAPGSPAGPEPGEPSIPRDTDGEGYLDVLDLPRAVPADGGEWLLVTELVGEPGAGFQVQLVPRNAEHAQGGDVLVRLLQEAGSSGEPAVRAEVWAVAGGRMILAGTWARQDPAGWAEQVRPAVAFAMGMLAELEDHGADLGARHRVRLEAADAAGMGVLPGITSGRVPITGRPQG
jgi:hypothetical protein